MDKNERFLHAQQHKDRVDLTIQHAKTWDKFQERKEDYSQKYGASHATILLQQEKEALEAEFNQEISDLAQRHDEQWLNYQETPASDKPYNLPSFLQKTETAKDQVDPTIQEKTVSHVMPDSPQRTLFINPLKQADKEPNQTPRNQIKDLDQSQDYLNSKLAAQKETLNKENSEPTAQKFTSMSARFSQGLSYTRAAEQPKRSPERSKDLDRD